MNSLRFRALSQIAAIAAKEGPAESADLDRLAQACSPPPKRKSSARPDPPARLSVHEIEAVLALARAAPSAASPEAAHTIATRLAALLPQTLTRQIQPVAGAQALGLAPWQVLAYQITAGMMVVAKKDKDTLEIVSDGIRDYIVTWESVAAKLEPLASSDPEEAPNIPSDTDADHTRIIALMSSFTGFALAMAEAEGLGMLPEKAEMLNKWQRLVFGHMKPLLIAAVSSIRDCQQDDKVLAPWKKLLHRHDISLQPLGFLLVHDAYARLLASLCATQIRTDPNHLLDELFLADSQAGFQVPASRKLDAPLASLTNDEWKRLDSIGMDIIQHESGNEDRLINEIRASAILANLYCSILSDEPQVLAQWIIEACLPDTILMSDPVLSNVCFRSLGILSQRSDDIAAKLSLELPALLGQSRFHYQSAVVVAETLALALRPLSQSVTINVLYTLGNLISPSLANGSGSTGPGMDNDGEARSLRSTTPSGNSAGGGADPAGSGPDSLSAYPSVIHSIVQSMVCLAVSSDDEKIINLALSMLVQKIGVVSTAVDGLIISEVAVLSFKSNPDSFKRHLDFLDQACYDATMNSKGVIVKAVAVARNYLSMVIKRDSELFNVYLTHMLSSIIAKGELTDKNRNQKVDTGLAAREISEILSPLASLVSANYRDIMESGSIEGLASLSRDAWHNIVINGFSYKSAVGMKFLKPLQILAYHSLPLITKDHAGRVESDIELNPILRRGESPEQTAEHKNYLLEMLPSCESSIRALSYSETVFIKTAHLIETLRAEGGNCTEVLTYFLDPRLQYSSTSGVDRRSNPLGDCMTAIAERAVRIHLKQTLSGRGLTFSSHHLAIQLAIVFSQCCHRISTVRNVAITSAQAILKTAPSALCQQQSLFTLLDLMSQLWESCLERETDEYGWKSSFTTAHAGYLVELSDDFGERQQILQKLHHHATEWMHIVIDMAPLDVKELLQAYLSHPLSQSTQGHISFGRSFAIEMGFWIPSSDQRLKSIRSQHGLKVDSASDFIAQYQSSQRYQLMGSLVGGVPGDSSHVEKHGLLAHKQRSLRKVEHSLKSIHRRLVEKEELDWDSEISGPLRHAGAVLSGLSIECPTLVRYFVQIPFTVFSKKAIRQGISLWTVVMKTNPRLESRILIEVTNLWENTVQKKMGMYSTDLIHTDPFYTRQEFAPSNKAAIERGQKKASDTIVPHLLLIQFLSSHFYAVHLATPHLRRVYLRFIHLALSSTPLIADHPLTRESHLQLVVLGIDIIQHCTDLSESCRWRFLDRILDAALSWFVQFPRYSFGGNRLQIKAETYLIESVYSALLESRFMMGVSKEALPALQMKQRLLMAFLEDEYLRLQVWLRPMHHTDRIHLSDRQTKPSDRDIAADIKTAWKVNPKLAVRIAQRLKSPVASRLVRSCIVNQPELMADDPVALELFLGPELPTDVSDQLKYLLYWAPVSPITAVSYFLPAYRNDPFVTQYALRSLDSHPVDITFFYVPQIVQALRYDSLGYVERYILEAGMVSALFAHQIIWNMKANMYRDETAEVEDSIKPVLDSVMDHLVSRFTAFDRQFYETEFSFFNEVTDISGKLKPYIGQPKEIKRQKIEEELRKIKLEVGVYLPSNPDGVVVGIDRTSGKPLQSHAKAPYMATFRIRKQIEHTDMIEGHPDYGVEAIKGVSSPFRDTWQSAIFKVGDDCRQDVLVLQLISTFRSVFNDIGLDVYVFPYRVTATAPGCGVIDVLPNSISRDMLGREAVNGLYDYFVSKYGREDSTKFQVARSNFVKSMAAYSIISYLLQLKDRHNGNIMIDDAGHIIHIDFGFCFDIAPGGIKFERAPFKLTAEMVAVMGGTTSAQPFVWFEELCIKTFLACRQHADRFTQLVSTMLDSALPCFKPATIANFRSRFELNMTDPEAAEMVRDLVRKSYGSLSTTAYDMFQLRTNGIPF